MVEHRRTLDQQRAEFAWQKASEGMRGGAEYKALAKGAPALIMGSGLMPALAFWRSKGDRGHHALLLAHVCSWLSTRFAWKEPGDFESIMPYLHAGSSTQYMEATEEALQVLKWIRQYVGAVDVRSGGLS